MNLLLRLSVILLVSCLCIEAKYYETPCDLVKELRIQNFPEEKMADWVCLIENESARRTDALGKVNKNGSRDHGLFQINDKWWCSNTTTPGNTCNVTCADLRTDNISKASICAQIIFRRQGFIAWHGWEKRCQQNLPDISLCEDVNGSKMNNRSSKMYD